MPDLIDHLTLLARLRDAEVLDQALTELARELLACRGAAIHRLLPDDGTRRWFTTAASGEPPALVAVTPHGDDGPALRGYLQLQRPITVPGTPLRTVLPLPDTEGQTPGVLELVLDAPMPDGPARVVSSLLRFHGQLRGLIDESKRDTLTGLLNRKTFDETFVRAAQGTRLTGERPASVGGWFLGMVDIDHFKRINDTHGHLIGDEVLLLVARTMLAHLRLGDRLYRFGGEEFIALLRAPDADTARVAFDRLRQTIEVSRFPQVQRLTVSIGFTAVDGDDTPGRAIERADRAVYAAKDRGRNLTVCDDDLGAGLDEAPSVGASEIEYF